VLVFEHPCIKKPVAVANCGQRVKVIRREGEWLRIRLPDGVVRYVGMASVSKDPDEFIPFQTLLQPMPSMNLAECNAVRAQHTANEPAELLHSPAYSLDEYAESDLEQAVDGTILLSGRVKTDGRAHELKIEFPMRKELDEKAVVAVENSRFAPALIRGRAVPSQQVNFEVAVRFTCFTGSARSIFCVPFVFLTGLH
jgi:hypothetical protein